jgi:hypothetical protein
MELTGEELGLLIETMAHVEAKRLHMISEDKYKRIHP